MTLGHTKLISKVFYHTSRKGKKIFKKLSNSYPVSMCHTAAKKKMKKIMLDCVLKVHSVTHLLFRYKKNFMISFSYIILFIITFHELRFKPWNESVLEVSVYLEMLTSDAVLVKTRRK